MHVRFHRPNPRSHTTLLTGLLSQDDAEAVHFSHSGKSGGGQVYHTHRQSLSVQEAEKILKGDGLMGDGIQVLEIQNAGRDARHEEGHFIRFGIPEPKPVNHRPKRKPSALALLEASNAKRHKD